MTWWHHPKLRNSVPLRIHSGSRGPFLPEPSNWPQFSCWAKSCLGWVQPFPDPLPQEQSRSQSMLNSANTKRSHFHCYQRPTPQSFHSFFQYPPHLLLCYRWWPFKDGQSSTKHSNSGDFEPPQPHFEAPISQKCNRAAKCSWWGWPDYRYRVVFSCLWRATYWSLRWVTGNLSLSRGWFGWLWWKCWGRREKWSAGPTDRLSFLRLFRWCELRWG